MESANEEEDLALALESAAEEDATASLLSAADIAAGSEYCSVLSEWEELSDADKYLIVGIHRNSAAAVRQALCNGANVNTCVRRGRMFSSFVAYDTFVPPLVRACRYGFDDIVRILLEACADTRWDNGSALVVACEHGFLSTGQLLLEHDNGLIEIGGKEALSAAVYMNQAGAVRFLLERGVNVDAIDDDGRTELMYASRSGKRDIVRLLLIAGANPDARDHHQETALHYAVRDNADIDVVRTLMDDHNANILAEDRRGDTPFDDVAGDYDFDHVVDCMLQMYGNKLVQYHGRLALHVILRSAEYPFVAAEDDYDNHDDYYWHPPMVSSVRIRLPLGKKHVTLSQFRIVLRSMDVELIRNRDNSGKLPIHIACVAEAPVQVLSMLVEMDPATLQTADHTGSLPIHLLCCSGTTPTDYVSLRYLVDQGGVGTLAARNRMGALPLHNLVASASPTLRTVQDWIQSFPGSVTARMNDGRYPFMVAACETSSASLSVIYELVRANPNLIIPKA